jgi:ankyrin repeat protein
MARSELGQYDGHGWSALHYAAAQADGAIAGALLAAGADPKQPTRKGHKYARQAFAAGATPREIARAVGATAVVERLA